MEGGRGWLTWGEVRPRDGSRALGEKSSLAPAVGQAPSDVTPSCRSPRTVSAEARRDEQEPGVGEGSHSVRAGRCNPTPDGAVRNNRNLFLTVLGLKVHD